MLSLFRKITLSTAALQKFQENVRSSVDSIVACPIIDGVLLEKVELKSATTTYINHKLGRKPQGWLIVRQRGNSIIWDLQDNNKNKTSTLALACSADVIVDVWIF